MVSQKQLVLEFFIENSNRDVETREAVDWAVAEWKKRTGEVFRDPDRAIRSLHQEGSLIKVATGVYHYDPEITESKKFKDFTPEQKKIIKEKYEYRCAMCGKGKREGFEIHIDHIKSRDFGGKSTLDNGQVLCSKHNNFKKNYKQTETGKRMFMGLYEKAQVNNDEHLKNFLSAVLYVFYEYYINGHIIWKKK